MRTKLHLWSIAVGVLECAGFACAQTPSESQCKPVAVWNGEQISQEELNKAAAPELERLEQKRQQFLITLERDKKNAYEEALDDIVNDKLLAAEAKKKNISVDDLVKAEVDEKVVVPSEDAVRKFYDD